MAEKNPGKPESSKSDEAAADRSGERPAMMFAFDDQSPQPSPRKEEPSPQVTPRKDAASAAAAESPTASPRAKKMTTAADFLTQSSPPRFVSFDEIMKAANGVQNMALAHEIAVDNDFRFQKQELPQNSMEKRVQDIMHRAFWDVLAEKLREDPSDCSYALNLFEQIKEGLQDLILPHNKGIRTEMEQVLDMDLIRQKADNSALDVRYYTDYVISVMAKVCAPVRDEQIAKLKETKDLVATFKAVFEMLDVLKLDMANFTIQQIRPYMQNQSVEYERKKFEELLKQQRENGNDGLECTKAWLHRAGDKIYQQMAAPPAASSSNQQPQNVASPAAILNTAYTELLEWPENYVFPETLLMDQKRFADLKEKCQWLGLVSSVLMVTYNTIGDPIAGVRSFKVKLKDNIAAIIAGVPFDRVSEVMPNVAAQVTKEVQSCLKETGHPEMVPDRVSTLQGLVEGVADREQPVHKLLRTRLLSHIRGLLSSPNSPQIAVPSGFAAMAEEFSHVYGQFLRLVSHNRSVFGIYYAEIISSYLKSRCPDAAQESS